MTISGHHSQDPVVGMKLDEFMGGKLEVVTDSPLRKAQITNALKNNGLDVEPVGPGLSNKFAGLAAPEQPVVQSQALTGPALKMSLGFGQS